MTLFHLRVFAFMLAGLVIILGLTRCGDDRHPLVVDATPAATTLCTKSAPVCDEACVRLTVTRKLT